MYTIHPIITGFTHTSKGTYLYHHSVHKYFDCDGFLDLPVTVFLVQGGGRKILIDTGMSDTERAGKYHHPGSKQPEGFAIYDQLKKIGIECGEIDAVVFTHLHWDHVYYLDHFPGADLYVQKNEYEFALNPIPLYHKSYEYPAIGIKPQFEGRSFNLLEGETKIMDGISVYPSPGHSVGHQTVVVKTRDGDYHCCGDLIFTYDNLREIPEIAYDISPPGRFLDIVDAWHSIVELKKRAASREMILPTHAPEMKDLVNSGRILGA
ncbi:MAG: N-acyl homoserine lactonase family protein [Treponema sp.]|jgi:glyoxylase-like metal-dependent hydrolase (beta-lactamase superfamily II)|nr:N-acyl homoserine lactonase family protein [Treponema sp.]